MHSLVRRFLKTAIVFLGIGLLLGPLQATGIGVFFYTMWQRIRPAGSQTREAQGQRF